MFKTLKTNAKRAMSGAWGRGIGIMFLVVIPGLVVSVVEWLLRKMTGTASMMDYAQTPELVLDNMANLAGTSILITLLMTVLLYLVTAPMVQGTFRWFYRRTGGANEGVSEVFHYYESGRGYKRSIGLKFQIDLRMFLWSLLMVVPLMVITIAVIIMSASGQGDETTAMPILILLIFGWTILTTVVITIVQLRYFLAPYVLADNPELTAGQALKSGIKQMRGHKGKVFMFGLSFLLWYLPLMLMMVLAMAIPFAGGMSSAVLMFGGLILLLILQFAIMFYLYAYQGAAMAMYARYIIESGRNVQDGMTREYGQQQNTLTGAPETAQSYQIGVPEAPQSYRPASPEDSRYTAPEAPRDEQGSEPPRSEE